MKTQSAKKSSRVPTGLKSSKIQLRLQKGQKTLIACAAEIKNTTLTQFMVDHAYTAAQEVLADQNHFTLSRKKWEAFCAELDRPARELPALKKLLTEPSIFEIAESDAKAARSDREESPSARV